MLHIKNSVITTNKEDIEKKDVLHSDDNTYYAVIDGSAVHNWDSYWECISKAFKFPELPNLWKPDYHSYYDFMTDLSWIKKDKFVLLIENSCSFLSDDAAEREFILTDFNEYLLPFWEEEAANTTVGGSNKSFMVYLVS